MQINYPVIIKSVLADIDPRKKEILERRFGLANGHKGETLQAIGDDLHITRERVRQIISETINHILETKGSVLKAPFDHLEDYFQKNGGLKKEEKIYREIASVEFNGPVYFFLSACPKLNRFSETENYYDFWASKNEAVSRAEKTIETAIRNLEKTKEPAPFETLKTANPYHLPPQALLSYIEISKLIAQSMEGLFGLVSWPEINPRGIRDRAYIILKKSKEPMHFMEITRKINELPINQKQIIPESVHNELIRSSLFVLVGRGIYALREWGYEPGTVKEIIIKILEKTGKPLRKDDILKEVLNQRKVKENTIILGLQDKTIFTKTPEGKIALKR